MASGISELYEPLIGRELDAIPAAVRTFRESHSSDDLFDAVSRFAILAYAPSQHAKHAVLACLAARELREEFGGRWDELLTECAIYTAASRQPWSEPPIGDPPAIDEDQRGDLEELLAAIDAQDRLRAERWLAKRLETDDYASDYLTAAATDFEDFGHKLIVATAAWKHASSIDPRGRFPTLRIGVWEMTAYRDGERYVERGNALDAEALTAQLIDRATAEQGSLESMHAVFLLDAAMEGEVAELRVRDYLSAGQDPSSALRAPSPLAEGRRASGDELPIYRLARDCGQYLKSWAVSKRLASRFPNIDTSRLRDAAWWNLQHGPSFEEFSFA